MKIRVVALAIAVFALRPFIFSRAEKAPDPYQDENLRSLEELAKFWVVVLGVGRNASHLEIQMAFHRLSFYYPPHKNKNEGAQEKLSEIDNAFGFSDDWSNYFGGDTSGAGHFGGFGGFGGSSSTQSGSLGGSSGGPFSGFNGTHSTCSGSRNHPKSIQDINFQVFEEEIVDQGITWLLLSYSPSLNDIQDYESVIKDVATSLQGALKAGRINCETQQSFCSHLGIYPQKAPRVFVYSQRDIIIGSFVEYKDDWAVKNLKIFCQEHLPRFSRRVELDTFQLSSGTMGWVPSVMLLSTKKDTPVLWRVLSGLYRKRFIFYNVVVHNASDKAVKKLGVDALPAIVGWMSNGKKHVLKTGIYVEDFNSGIQELSTLLNGFERKNKKAASSQAKNVEAESVDKQIH